MVTHIRGKSLSRCCDKQSKTKKRYRGGVCCADVYFINIDILFCIIYSIGYVNIKFMEEGGRCCAVVFVGIFIYHSVEIYSDGYAIYAKYGWGVPWGVSKVSEVSVVKGSVPLCEVTR